MHSHVVLTHPPAHFTDVEAEAEFAKLVTYVGRARALAGIGVS